MVPVENWLIGGLGWQNALFDAGLPGAGHRCRWPSACASRPAAAAGPGRAWAALREAFAYRSFRC
jgi:hypothetical protein